MKEIFEFFKAFIDEAAQFFLEPLFTHGKASFSIGGILITLFAIILLFYISSKIKKILVHKVLAKYSIDRGIAQSIATIIRYIIIVVGLFIIMQSIGIDLRALGIVAGALGVGIGFGLQNIVNNFISGIIILFENPIKVGDRIRIGEIHGNVSKISARSTTIITNENIIMVVPNADFINKEVVNLTYNDAQIAIDLPFGVAYKEDPAHIRELLVPMAKTHQGVLDTPAPDVLFKGFGSSSLDFVLRVWTDTYTDKELILKSELYYQVFELFKANEIEIPFPQRDIHVRSNLAGEPLPAID